MAAWRTHGSSSFGLWVKVLIFFLKILAAEKSYNLDTKIRNKVAIEKQDLWVANLVKFPHSSNYITFFLDTCQEIWLGILLGKKTWSSPLM